VEQWLRSLCLAPKTKLNLRTIFHVIYTHALRWNFTDRNPIALVRQSGGRRAIPRILTVQEIKLLLAQLGEPYRTMVLVAASLGLRASEIMGLQWSDFDWGNRAVLIRRGVVNGRPGDTKTEALRKALPIDSALADALLELRRTGSAYTMPDNWVFANRVGRPRCQQDILRRHIRPAAARAGLGKIGWHTFRHSYSTLLRSMGADIKVQQELLRHSTVQSTMNVYTQAVSGQKRIANSAVVDLLFGRIALVPVNGNQQALGAAQPSFFQPRSSDCCCGA
jgi:integrase